MSITVVIADDHQILVAALQSALAVEPDITVVGTAHDGDELLALVAQARPDVAIVDIGMPGVNGIEATQRLSAGSSATKVLILSAYDDKRFVLEAMNAGAAGYVVKSSAADELPRAIRAVALGRTYLCPEVAGAVADAMRGRGNAHAGQAGHADIALAPRERVIVRLLAEGRSSVQIAAELSISPSTVDTHRRNIMRKLDIHNVADLTRYAIREGITVA
jgi:two-component system NarL family response regulator